MNFKCEELSISDDPDFGCTITFSDTRESDTMDLSISDLMNLKERDSAGTLFFPNLAF